MKKRSRKKQKNKGLFLVAIAVLVVGIGFAALQKYLTIDGTASINSNFDVRFSWIDTADIVGGAYNKSEPSVTGTTATFDAAFLAPGDSISYNIYIDNLGTMNAKLENIDVNIENNENISYEITGINNGDIIEALAYSARDKGDGPGFDVSRKNINLKLTYNGDGSEASTSSVKVTMKFIQTNEQTNNQSDAISIIESEKPKVSYDILGISNEANENGQIPYKIYLHWNSENSDQLVAYYLGVEVYQSYVGDIWITSKNATDELFLTYGTSGRLKIRYVYSINGVKYYSQYSDEFNIIIDNIDGFIYSDNMIAATDDSYFPDGVMTLPVGVKFNKLTSNNVTRVILPEDYNLSDLGENSLPTKQYYGTSLDTIVNKTGQSIDWAPIVGWFASDGEGNRRKCEFVTGTCAGVNIVAE